MRESGGADALFLSKEPSVRETYRRLLDAFAAFGPFREEAKQTSIHLATKSAFAGVHPQKRKLLLNLRTAQPISSPRVRKAEQVSRNRVHNEILLSSPGEVDSELLVWLEEAYRLASE